MKNQIAAFATLLSIGCLLPLTADCQTVVTLTQTNLGAKVQISSREECAEKVSVLKETADEVRILHGNNELENVTDVEEFCGKQFPEKMQSFPLGVKPPPQPTGGGSCSLVAGHRYSPVFSGVYENSYWSKHKIQADGLKDFVECEAFCEQNLPSSGRNYCSFYKWHQIGVGGQTGTICYLLRDVAEDAILLQTTNIGGSITDPFGGGCIRKY